MSMKDYIKRLMKPNAVRLGDKAVKIEKVTPRQYKELFSVIGSIPNLLVSVMEAPKEEYAVYMLSALEVGLEDFINVVSMLTGIEEDYLYDNVGLDEITEYLVRMSEHNNLENTLKNVKSLLPQTK